MDELIAGFTKQLSEALKIGEKAALKKSGKTIKNVLVSGLGGSGIGANLVGEFTAGELKVPFAVNKDYHLPAYVDENTLLIISSYSGNTEETLSALKDGMKKGAQIVCVTSNGKIAEIAKENKLGLIAIPGGMPPRACLGYSFVQQLFILNHHGLISSNFIQEIKTSVELLDDLKEGIKSEAREIAGKLYKKIPVIYISSHMEAVAVRFRQQINENSKKLCWHHAIPEMNHNELVGWRDKNEELAVVIFRNENDYERVQQRIEINKNIIQKYTPNIIEVYSKGSSDIQRALYLIHLGDWVSFYLAEKRKMDAVEVNVIDYLKGELAKT